LARRLLWLCGMQQTIITTLGFIGLLMLILLGSELKTELDFSLRRFHAEHEHDQASAAPRPRASGFTDPRCERREP